MLRTNFYWKFNNWKLNNARKDVKMFNDYVLNMEYAHVRQHICILYAFHIFLTRYLKVWMCEKERNWVIGGAFAYQYLLVIAKHNTSTSSHLDALLFTVSTCYAHFLSFRMSWLNDYAPIFSSLAHFVGSVFTLFIY